MDNMDRKIWTDQKNLFIEESNFDPNSKTQQLKGTKLVVYNKNEKKIKGYYFADDDHNWIQYNNDSGGGGGETKEMRLKQYKQLNISIEEFTDSTAKRYEILSYFNDRNFWDKYMLNGNMVLLDIKIKETDPGEGWETKNYVHKIVPLYSLDADLRVILNEIFMWALSIWNYQVIFDGGYFYINVIPPSNWEQIVSLNEIIVTVFTNMEV